MSAFSARQRLVRKAHVRIREREGDDIIFKTNEGRTQNKGEKRQQLYQLLPL